MNIIIHAHYKRLEKTLKTNFVSQNLKIHARIGTQFLAWNKEVSQLGKKEADDFGGWVGDGFGGVPVSIGQVLPPYRKFHLLAVSGVHQGQGYPT